MFSIILLEISFSGFDARAINLFMKLRQIKTLNTDKNALRYNGDRVVKNIAPVSIDALYFVVEAINGVECRETSKPD